MRCRQLLTFLLSFLPFLCTCRANLQNQNKTSLLPYINRALARTFASLEGNITGVPRLAVPHDYSLVYKLCDHLRDRPEFERIGCCTPNDVRHLYNVKIYDNKLVVYSNGIQTNTTKDWVLPWVRSVLPMKRSLDKLSVVFVNGPLIPEKHCKEYFNGTLHFAGRSTVHNVYHALGDNFLPLAGQMILDYYLASDMLYAPRFILTDFQKKGHPEPLNTVRGRSFSANTPLPSNTTSQSRHSSLPSQQRSRNRSRSKSNTTAKSSVLLPESLHLRLMEDVMSEGALSLSQASGMCFRRVVWGHGPHMFYTAMLQRLRRLVSRFAREFAKELIHYQSSVRNETIVNPWSLEKFSENITIFVERKRQLSQLQFQNITVGPAILSNAESNITQKPLINDRGEPLKVILFSRGTKNTPKSRSMENEQAVISALQARGAQAVICCDYRKTSIFQQLYNAINADVMIGLHGAALAHGVFMSPGSITIELKTLYAYESLLFPLISDAHSGIHAQVDVRDYYQRRIGGHLPMDDSLVKRIVNMVDQTVQYRTTLRLRGESIRFKNMKELQSLNQQILSKNDKESSSVTASLSSALYSFFFKSRRTSEELTASLASFINNITTTQNIPSWVDGSAASSTIDYENSFLSEEYALLACADTPSLSNHNNSHYNTRSLRIMLNILSRINFFGLNTVHPGDLINLSKSNHSLLNNNTQNLFVQSRLWMLPMVVVPSDMYVYRFQEFISLSPVSHMSITPARPTTGQSSYLSNFFRSGTKEDPNKALVEKTLDDKRNNIFSRTDSSSWVRHPEYHKLGDFIFPLLCSTDNTQPLFPSASSRSMIDPHVLGPPQHTHTQDCLQSAFQLWRLVLMDQSLVPVGGLSGAKPLTSGSSNSGSSLPKRPPPRTPSSSSNNPKSRSSNQFPNPNAPQPRSITPHDDDTVSIAHPKMVNNNVINAAALPPIKRKPNRPLPRRPPQPRKQKNSPQQVDAALHKSQTPASFASPAHRVLQTQTNTNNVQRIGSSGNNAIADKYRSKSLSSALFLPPVSHLSAAEYMQHLLHIAEQQLRLEDELVGKQGTNAVNVEEDTGGVHCRMCETFGGS